MIAVQNFKENPIHSRVPVVDAFFSVVDRSIAVVDFSIDVGDGSIPGGYRSDDADDAELHPSNLAIHASDRLTLGGPACETCETT